LPGGYCFGILQQPAAHTYLFIGNSYTSLNDGLDKQLKGLAASAETECIARGDIHLKIIGLTVMP